MKDLCFKKVHRDKMKNYAEFYEKLTKPIKTRSKWLYLSDTFTLPFLDSKEWDGFNTFCFHSGNILYITVII